MSLTPLIPTALLQDPKVKAFLSILADRESGGRYDVIVGGAKIEDFDEHPNVRVRIGGVVSTAAGAYQFTNPTWRELAVRDLGLTNFSPQSQDIAAARLLSRLGVFDHLLAGRVDEAVFAAGKRWDAFPINAQGNSISGGTRPARPIVEAIARKTASPGGG